MLLYFVIMLSLFAMAWSVKGRSEVPLAWFRYLVCLMAVFTGFRYEIGCDYNTYKIHFDMQNPHELFENINLIDPLYWILIDLLSYMGLWYEILNIITAIVFFFGLYLFAKSFKNPIAILAFSFPVMIIALPMSATRQALAAGILMAGFKFLMERKYVLYAAITVIASQFHSSALVFLGLLPVVSFGGTLLSWIVASPILIFGLLRAVGTAEFEIANERYIISSNDAAGAIYRTFLLFPVGIYYHVYMKRIWAIEMPHSFPLINAMSYLLIALFPLAFFYPTIADRYSQYFFIVSAIIISKMPYIADLRQKNDNAFVVFMLMFSVFFVSWSALSWQIQECYNPYEIWLFGFPSHVTY